MVQEKTFPKVFLTSSQNEEEVTDFSDTPIAMVMSVGEPPTAGFSIERSDSSEIYSRSRVPLEVAN